MRAPAGRLLQLVLLASLALGLATGCSDEPDKPGTLPKPSPTSSSGTPTPDTAEEQVEAAVRAYYAELTRAAQTNDTSKLRTMTTKGCPCYRPVEVIEENEAKGRSTPEASFQITSIRVHDIEGKTALAEVRTREAAYKVLDGSDAVIGRVPARSHFLDLSLVQSEAGNWIIANEFNLGGKA